MRVLPLAIALALLASRAGAQACFENDPLLPGHGSSRIVTVGDADADGDLDAWEFDVGSYGVYHWINQGGGSWSSYGINVNGLFLTYLDAFDFDGDGRAELGATYYNGTVKVLRFDGSTVSSVDLPGRANHCAVADVDLDGDLDLAVASTVGASGSGAGRIAFHTVNSQLVAGPAILDEVERVAFGDFDADGDADLALLRASVVHVATNDGAGAFTLLPTTFLVEGIELAVADFDDDGRDDLAVGQTFDRVSVLISVPGGFAPPVELAIGHHATNVVAGDFDLDSAVDFVVAGGGSSFVSVFHNAGSGTFAPPVGFECGSPVTLDAGDLDGDGDGDLFIATGVNGLRVLRNCAVSGTPTCFGDGTATACPCGNASPVGARAGCRHSFGTGGTLRASGAASIAADSVVLRGASMPDAPALFLQGTSAENGGAGSVFGDGLRCAAGTVTRLGIATNVAGASQYPAAGQPSVSVRGAVTSPGTRHYQVWYRNAASFCTPSGFNLTNALRLTWRP